MRLRKYRTRIGLQVARRPPLACWRCDGLQWTRLHPGHTQEPSYRTHPCETCQGTGRIPRP